MSVVVRVSENYVGFHCPGCDDYHQIRTGENGWTWNGSLTAPTFSPSVLVTYHDDQRCHSFVRAGRIEFLSDCTHALAGQTIDLPEWTGFPGSSEVLTTPLPDACRHCGRLGTLLCDDCIDPEANQ